MPVLPACVRPSLPHHGSAGPFTRAASTGCAMAVQCRPAAQELAVARRLRRVRACTCMHACAHASPQIAAARRARRSRWSSRCAPTRAGRGPRGAWRSSCCAAARAPPAWPGWPSASGASVRRCATARHLRGRPLCPDGGIRGPLVASACSPKLPACWHGGGPLDPGPTVTALPGCACTPCCQH